MGIISIILLYIFLFFTSYMLGYIFPRDRKLTSNDKIAIKKDSSIQLLCYGFAYHIALFEVIFIPFYLLGTSFNTVVIAYIIIILIAFIYFLIKLKNDLNDSNTKISLETLKKLAPEKIQQIVKEFTIPLVIFIIVVIFQAFFSSYMTHTDADDGYMTTVSTIAYLENKINLSFWGVYDGLDVNSGRASIFCWEIFIGALSRIFGIHPAILDHSVIIPFLLILCYMAVYLIADQLFEKERRNVVMLLYSLLIMFCAYSTYALGCRMLLRLWQGKNVMVGFLMPLLMHSCLKIYYGDYSWKRFITNVILIVSGIGMTVIGIYFMPISYAVYGLPLLIYLLFTKRFKDLGEIMKKLIITVIPVLIVMVIAFVNSIGKEEDGTNIGQTYPDWMYSFQKTFGESYILPLFITSVIVILIEYFVTKKQNKDLDDEEFTKNARIRLIYVFIPVFMALTLLNPLLCSFVSYNITSVPVYWRLYWIIPLQLIIAIAMSYLIFLTKKKIINYIILLVMIFIVIFSGTNIFKKDTLFTNHWNFYMVPIEVITASDQIMQEKADTEDGKKAISRGSVVSTAAFPAEISYYVRQYESRIGVVGSRSFQGGDRMIGDTDKNYAWLYDMIYVYHALDDPEVISSLNILSTEYVFIYGEYIDNVNYEATNIQNVGYLYKLKED